MKTFLWDMLLKKLRCYLCSSEIWPFWPVWARIWIEMAQQGQAGPNSGLKFYGGLLGLVTWSKQTNYFLPVCVNRSRINCYGSNAICRVSYSSFLMHANVLVFDCAHFVRLLLVLLIDPQSLLFHFWYSTTFCEK